MLKTWGLNVLGGLVHEVVLQDDVCCVSMNGAALGLDWIDLGWIGC